MITDEQVKAAVDVFDNFAMSSDDDPFSICMRQALQAAEAAAWLKAEAVPDRLKGIHAWVWEPGDSKPELGRIPLDHEFPDEDGVMYLPIEQPAMPRTEP